MCSAHVGRASANYQEPEKAGSREIRCLEGNKQAPLEIRLRSQCGAPACGIGGLGRDVAWAGRVGLRQWPRVPAVGADRGPAAQHSLAARAEGLSLSPTPGTASPRRRGPGPALPSAARTPERAGGWRRRAAHDEEGREARAERPRPAGLSAHPRRRDSGLPGLRR
ncbi:transmembrane protein 243 isoform X1 [Cervus canadensis]|uniref:transmembrane protein 243 isoform X1 n=1 Tax=Cervus canadensis TaxID=1574408 RepID=UPI001C9E4C07|nr:transmembrane protein 243 isoform X1 [Cervus canadensis]